MFAGLEIPFVFGLLATVFVLFMSERFSPDIIALGAVVLLLITGILETNEFLQVFSNGAPIAIAMMFIISAALEATGCLEVIGKFLHRIAGKSFFLCSSTNYTILNKAGGAIMIKCGNAKYFHVFPCI